MKLAPDSTLPALWLEQVSRTPNHAAVIFEDQAWTYAELDRVSRRFATQLRNAGVEAGDFVGLCVDRSNAAIAAMLGIMKLGAAFVPLDPEYPVGRLQYMLNDASIKLVVGHSHYRGLIQADNGKEETCSAQWMDCDQVAQAEDSEIELPTIKGGDVAYVMYTSGSTGNPKGVVIEHTALATYCAADIEYYGVSEADRTLQFSTLNFDIAIEEIFPPLLSGGCVVVRPRERSRERNELSSLIDQYRVTAVHLATAYWHEWVDLMVASKQQVPRSLRLMIVTGEKVSLQHYHRWQSICEQDVHWCNAYGPTEATVTATVFTPDLTFDTPEHPALNMPIGKALPGYEAFILDEQLVPVADGETGQLFLGGAALAREYLGRADLTRAAFIETEVGGQLKRLYRSGDLCRWLPDGNIDFAGRIDHQIKLGSYRIEPGEIEAIIGQHPEVLESLVIYEAVENQKYLIAYVATGENRPTAVDVSAFLKQRLPAYMVPTRYVFVESFPKTINGKIDRRSLPDASASEVPRDIDYVAPMNDLQRRLVQCWLEVLHVPQVGIHDDFFLLGGSSLLVTQVVTRLTTDMDIELPVRDFFANPTIASLSQHIEALMGVASAEDYLKQRDAAEVIRGRLPIAKPQFITLAEGAEIFSVLYQPRRNRLGHAIVLAGSIGHESTRGYRNLQQLAVHLTNLGFDVLRFDYRCSGNSTGHCEDLTVSSMQEDLRVVRDFVASECATEHVSIVGLRVGATVASTLPPDIYCNAVYWDPVVSGADFVAMLDQFHQRELTGMNRFNCVVKHSCPDQRYGHAFPQVKRASFESLAWVSKPEHYVVLTRGSAVPDSVSAAQCIGVSDVIGWDNKAYAERAFSSPESFEVIGRTLTELSCKETIR